MSGESITSKSPLLYQIAIFLVVNIWGIMSFEVAQYQLVTLYETPLSWIFWATIVLWSMTPILGLSAWKLKERVQIVEPKWNFKVREVSLSEFTEMVKSYNSSYRYLLASIDYPLLFVVLFVLYPLFCGLPFITMRTSILLISITPILLALFSIMFGLLLSYVMFKAIPNTASKEFPTHNPIKLKNSISFLSRIPGIFWVGVRLTIGEASGFYSMREPVPIARIEGIEGAARIECVLDDGGNILFIRPVFEMDSLKGRRNLSELIQPITPRSTAKLIESMIRMYIEHSGGEEILKDILDELSAFQAGPTQKDDTGK